MTHEDAMVIITQVNAVGKLASNCRTFLEATMLLMLVVIFVLIVQRRGA